MYEVLEDRSPKKFCSVLLIAFSFLALIFSAFSLLGYLIWGANVDSNVLVSIGTPSLWAKVSQISVILVIMAVFPIMLLPMLAPVRSLGLHYFLRHEQREALAGEPGEAMEDAVKTGLFRRRCVVNATSVVIVLISFVGALLITKLGFINVVDGSMCVGIFIALCPGLIGLFLIDRNTFVWKSAMWALLTIGAIVCIAGLILTDNYKQDLAKACIWGPAA